MYIIVLCLLHRMFTILDYSSALEYSIIRRYTNIVYYYYYYSAYCAYCSCFGTVLNYPFVNQGFKKAVGVKDGYLDRYANSADHISSSERVFGFLHCIKKMQVHHPC